MSEPLADKTGAEPLTLRVPEDAIGCGGPDQQYYFEEEPFTGVAYTLYHPGQVRSEQEFRNGHPNGFARKFYCTGVPQEVAHLCGGVYHGRRRRWHEDGRPESDERWEYGICVARQRWGESGELVEDYWLTPADPVSRTLEVYRQVYGQQPDGSDAEAEPGTAPDRRGMNGSEDK